MRRRTAVPSSSGTWGSAKRKVNMYGSPNRTITRTARCWRPSSIDWIGTPTLDSPCVSRGPSTRTANRWETIEICWNQNHSSHWHEDYVNAGHDECKNYLFWYNTIPNASAVLWRREILERAGGRSPIRVCGDWMAYINALQLSDIAFVSTPLNYSSTSSQRPH